MPVALRPHGPLPDSPLTLVPSYPDLRMEQVFARVPHTDAARLPVRAPRAHLARAVRSHLGVAADRMALGTGSADRARCHREQPGGRARLQEPQPQSPPVRCAADRRRALPRESNVGCPDATCAVARAARGGAGERLGCVKKPASDPHRALRDHLVELLRGGHARGAPRREAARPAIHRVAARRAHPHHAVGHRRVLEEPEAQVAEVARGLLAERRRAPRYCGLGHECRPGRSGPAGDGAARPRSYN